MTIKQRIEDDLKTAMLAGDKVLVTTLRGLKSAILNVEIAKGAREQGLPEAEVTDILSKESKKRQESADLFKQGGNEEKAAAELQEKEVIAQYLPQQLSDEELGSLIEHAIQELGISGPQAMGQVIGKVKAATAGQADGGRIAQMVKEKLS